MTIFIVALPRSSSPRCKCNFSPPVVTVHQLAASLRFGISLESSYLAQCGRFMCVRQVIYIDARQPSNKKAKNKRKRIFLSRGETLFFLFQRRSRLSAERGGHLRFYLWCFLLNNPLFYLPRTKQS